MSSPAVSEDAAAPAADMHFGAELEEAFGHFPAQAGAAAGDEDALAVHQAVAEHEFAGVHGGLLPLRPGGAGASLCRHSSAWRGRISLLLAPLAASGPPDSTISGRAG
jgi:hypothetical protein